MTWNAKCIAVSPYFPQHGLFLDSTYAIQVGSPQKTSPCSTQTAGSLEDDVDESILSVTENAESDKINMSQLY